MRGCSAIVLIALCALLASACKSDDKNASARSSPSPTAVSPLANDKNAAKIHGFLYLASNGVVFVQWTESDTALSGQMQIVRSTNEDRRVPESINRAFTGVHRGSQISLTFSAFGESETWTGTLNGDTLVLVAPQDSGFLSTFELKPGTVAEYNSAAATFLGRLSSARADATAAARAAQELASRQKAVEDANESLAEALDDLGRQTATLKRITSFTTILDGYAEEWASMQAEYTKQQTAMAKRPPDCSDARFYRNGVMFHLNGSNYYATGLEVLRSEIASTIVSLNQTIQEAEIGLEILSRASKANPTGVPPAAYSTEDVQRTTGIALAQIAASQAALDDVSSQATGFDQRARDFDSAAEQALTNVGC